MERYSVDMAASRVLKAGLPIMMLYDVKGVFYHQVSYLDGFGLISDSECCEQSGIAHNFYLLACETY